MSVIARAGGESSTELPEHSKSEPASSNDLDFADNKLFLDFEGADLVGFGMANDLGFGMAMLFEGGVRGGVRGVIFLSVRLKQGDIDLVGVGSVLIGYASLAGKPSKDLLVNSSHFSADNSLISGVLGLEGRQSLSKLSKILLVGLVILRFLFTSSI